MREALYLRFGTETPCKLNPPRPLLTLKTVAELRGGPIHPQPRQSTGMGSSQPGSPLHTIPPAVQQQAHHHLDSAQGDAFGWYEEEGDQHPASSKETHTPHQRIRGEGGGAERQGAGNTESWWSPRLRRRVCLHCKWLPKEGLVVHRQECPRSRQIQQLAMLGSLCSSMQLSWIVDISDQRVQFRWCSIWTFPEGSESCHRR